MGVRGPPLSKTSRISREAFGAVIHKSVQKSRNDTSIVCDLILKAMGSQINRFETRVLYRSFPDLEILTTMVVVR